MNPNDMATLIAGQLGGEVNDKGEIVASGFEVVNPIGPESEPAPPAPKDPPANSGQENKGTPAASEPGDSSLKNEKTFDELLAEKSGGKFKSWEEIEKLQTPKQEFANDIISKLNEFSKKFQDPNTAVDLFFKTQLTDYATMDEAEAIKLQIRLDNPELTDKEIEHEFKQKYKIDEDLFDEETVELSKIKLERDAKKAKDALIEMQKEFATNGDKDPELEKQFLENKQNWEKSVDSAIPALEKISLQISDKDTIDWSFSEQERAEAANVTKGLFENASVFFEMFKDEKGNYDHKKIAESYMKLKRFDDILKSAVDQAINSGRMQEIQDLKNADFKAASRSGQPVPESVEEQVAKQFLTKM